MIVVVNLEEEFVSMKATLERLSKESTEKDARIKCREECIAKLLKKLDKGLRATMRTKKGLIEVRCLKMMVA